MFDEGVNQAGGQCLLESHGQHLWPRATRTGGKIQKIGPEALASAIPFFFKSSTYWPTCLKSISATRPPNFRTRAISEMASRRPSRLEILWIARLATTTSTEASANGN